jgi:hypothetical protein
MTAKRLVPRRVSRFARRWITGNDSRSVAGRAVLLGVAFLVGCVAA